MHDPLSAEFPDLGLLNPIPLKVAVSGSNSIQSGRSEPSASPADNSREAESSSLSISSNAPCGTSKAKRVGGSENSLSTKVPLWPQTPPR